MFRFEIKFNVSNQMFTFNPFFEIINSQHEANLPSPSNNPRLKPSLLRLSRLYRHSLSRRAPHSTFTPAFRSRGDCKQMKTFISFTHTFYIYISLFRLALNSFRFVSSMWVCVCFKHICTLINSMKPKAKVDPNLVFPITSMCGRFCASREKIAPNVLWHYTTHLTPTISHNMVFQHNSFSTHI